MFLVEPIQHVFRWDIWQSILVAFLVAIVAAGTAVAVAVVALLAWGWWQDKG